MSIGWVTIATVLVQCGPCHYAKAKAKATATATSQSQSQSQSSPHISHVCYTYMLSWNMEHWIVGVGRVFIVQSSLLRITPESNFITTTNSGVVHSQLLLYMSINCNKNCDIILAFFIIKTDKHRHSSLTLSYVLSLFQFPTQKPKGPKPTKPLLQVPYVNAFGLWTYIEVS